MKKLILIFIILLLTGCMNYNELNNLAIITTIGIDKDNDNYNVSFLVSTDTESNIVIKGNGKNISLSFDDAIKKLSKNAYFGHLKLILIDSKIAKEGITDVIDFLIRNYETIKKIRLVLVEDAKTSDILNIPIKLDNFSSNNILNILSSSNKRLSNSHDVLLSDFVYKIINYGYDNVLPVITINNGDIEVKNIGIFTNDKLVGYLDEYLSVIFNILTNNANSFNINLDGIMIKIDSSKSSIKLKDSTYHFDVDIKGFIIESNKKLEYTNEDMSNINKLLKEKIKYSVDNLINYSILSNSDILGLGNLLYRKDFYLYKKDYLKSINYEINISSSIQNQGALEKSLKDVIDEKD